MIRAMPHASWKPEMVPPMEQGKVEHAHCSIPHRVASVRHWKEARNWVLEHWAKGMLGKSSSKCKGSEVGMGWL